MNHDTKRSLAALAKPILAATIAVIGWVPIHATAQDASYAKYRCVMGDTAQCEPSSFTPDVRVEKQLVLGPIATYLVNKNESREAAALKAQELGEYAVERTVRITKRNLSDLEKYERSRGGSTTISDYNDETLAEVRIDARDHQRVAALLRDRSF